MERIYSIDFDIGNDFGSMVNLHPYFDSSIPSSELVPSPFLEDLYQQGSTSPRFQGIRLGFPQISGEDKPDCSFMDEKLQKDLDVDPKVQPKPQEAFDDVVSLLTPVSPRSSANHNNDIDVVAAKNYTPKFVQEKHSEKFKDKHEGVLRRHCKKEALSRGNGTDTYKPLLVPCYDLQNSTPFIFDHADASESPSFDYEHLTVAEDWVPPPLPEPPPPMCTFYLKPSGSWRIDLSDRSVSLYIDESWFPPFLRSVSLPP